MAIFVINQGRRVEHPLSSVIKPRVVNETTPVSAGSKIQKNLSRPANQPRTKDELVQKLAASAYSNGSVPKRQPAKYADSIMCSPVTCLYEADSIKNAFELFSTLGFRHIPILNADDALVGMLSDRRFLSEKISSAYLSGSLLPTDAVSKVMSQKVLTASRRTEIRELAGLMCQEKIGCLPIIDDQTKVVGIVSRTDILATLFNTAPIELWI